MIPLIILRYRFHHASRTLAETPSTPPLRAFCEKRKDFFREMDGETKKMLTFATR